MKTTIKEFTEKALLRKSLNRKAYLIKNEDPIKSQELTNEANELDKNYFDKVEKVFVSFYIGYRRYYREVSKIGKSYFDDTQKMNKRLGYRNIQEISEITEEMREQMIDDAHYY